jgi:hypothetical protein
MEITKEQVLDIYGTTGNLYLHSKLEKWFPEAFKVELEVGKVFKGEENIMVYITDVKSNNEVAGYGFMKDGKWSKNKKPYPWGFNAGITEATTAEWHDALIAEAKKRGYKNGNYECLYMPGCTEEVSNDFFIENQELWIGDLNTGNMIFKDGVWAKIIKTFSKEEAEKLLGGKII